MSYLLVIAVILAGAGGIIAQLLLVRTLWSVFQGNELLFGIILAHWLAGEAFHAPSARGRVELDRAPQRSQGSATRAGRVE